MDTKHFSKKILTLKERDENFRNELIKKNGLSKGYNSGMEKIHNKNAEELSQIIEEIGYPTVDKVGTIASDASWLIIQHSIGQPNFMKKSAKMLERAVQENKADPISLAYLKDRIAVFEGKEQRYGTQFDWDINGEMSPNQIDDIEKVNLRRKTLGLNSLEEQTVTMKERVKKENQSPPDNFQERKREYNQWRKSVGWIE